MNLLTDAAPAAISDYISTLLQMTLVSVILQRGKKAIVANYFLRCIVISLPGINSHAKLGKKDKSGKSILDFLKILGCKKAIVAYDADKNINEHLLRHEQKLVALLKNDSFHTYVSS